MNLKLRYTKYEQYHSCITPEAICKFQEFCGACSEKFSSLVDSLKSKPKVEMLLERCRVRFSGLANVNLMWINLTDFWSHSGPRSLSCGQSSNVSYVLATCRSFLSFNPLKKWYIFNTKCFHSNFCAISSYCEFVKIFTLSEWKEECVLETCLCIVFILSKTCILWHHLRDESSSVNGQKGPFLELSWQVLVHFRILKSQFFERWFEKWTTPF